MAMKRTMIGAMVVVLLAGVARADSALSLSGRYHRDRVEFTEYPFGEGDWSYMAALESHNEDAMVQLGAAVCPDFKDNEAMDYAITPQANLILKDRIFRGGLGVLSTYTKGEDEDDWTDMYWQFLLGVSFELPARLALDVFAVYPFESWDDLSDFSTDDVEFSAGLAWHF